MTGEDDLQLIEDSPDEAVQGLPWKLLVVDDDDEVHAVTHIALNKFSFEERSVQILSARSGQEARTQLESHPDVALILLDVVMESDNAGLELARHIREEMRNVLVRIVLRTGQPGQAPARQVVERYEIDDYRTKSELTYERLVTLVMTSLRTHRLLTQMEARRQDLEKSNIELESFAYAASHDLQTPVRSIRNFSQLLRRKYADRLDAEGREMLDFVINGSLQLYKLIGDLLEYSRAAHIHDGPVAVDLNQVLRKVADTLQPALTSRRVELHCHSLPTVHGHAVQLEQLFRNLVDNAIKFQRGAQGQVTVTAGRHGSLHEIRVTDQGIGIEQEYLEKIFELFKKLHHAEDLTGSGLGLALCRKIARLHGGTIHAESILGSGTTFVVRLP